jgi:tetratricopeptide (TPR) repeat protein
LQQGPADKLARAMKNGDFKQALDELDKLKQKLRAGDMDDEDRAKLAKQLDQMKQKLQDVADAHKQAMNDLQEQIKQARDSGNVGQADKLQQALDRLQQQMPQMDKLQDLAQKLGRASKALEQGQSDEAQQSLDQLASDLEQMQSELDELEALETTLDEIREAKNAMNCDQCGGGGCRACQGGDGQGRGGGGGQGKGGDGLGAAKGGRGQRPEAENKTSSYDSRVKGKVGPGKAVITGQADGPNARGRVREAIQAEFESQNGQPADPLTGQRLPKSHQRHVEEYFESLREGTGGTAND